MIYLCGFGCWDSKCVVQEDFQSLCALLDSAVVFQSRCGTGGNRGVRKGTMVVFCFGDELIMSPRYAFFWFFAAWVACRSFGRASRMIQFPNAGEQNHLVLLIRQSFNRSRVKAGSRVLYVVDENVMLSRRLTLAIFTNQTLLLHSTGLNQLLRAYHSQIS